MAEHYRIRTASGDELFEHMDLGPIVDQLNRDGSKVTVLHRLPSGRWLNLRDIESITPRPFD